MMFYVLNGKIISVAGGHRFGRDGSARLAAAYERMLGVFTGEDGDEHLDVQLRGLITPSQAQQRLADLQTCRDQMGWSK